MSTERPAIAYSASNRVVFSGKVARTQQSGFFNSIITFRHRSTASDTQTSSFRRCSPSPCISPLMDRRRTMARLFPGDVSPMPEGGP